MAACRDYSGATLLGSQEPVHGPKLKALSLSRLLDQIEAVQAVPALWKRTPNRIRQLPSRTTSFLTSLRSTPRNATSPVASKNPIRERSYSHAFGARVIQPGASKPKCLCGTISALFKASSTQVWFVEQASPQTWQGKSGTDCIMSSTGIQDLKRDPEVKVTRRIGGVVTGI